MEDRYSRQILVKGFGEDNQSLLDNTAILVVGAGGLGSPVVMYLAGAGVGHIGIIDDDVVSKSNLHRQVWYSETDVGQSKAICLGDKASKLNPTVSIDVYNTRLTAQNIEMIFEKYAVVVDATDNFETRYLINDACIQLDKALVFGAVYQYEGQVTVFNQDWQGINYRDIFPHPPQAGSIPSCNDAGVLGTSVAYIASIMSHEVIKLQTTIGSTLYGKMATFNLNTLQSFIVKIKKTYDNSRIDFKSTDYHYLCNSKKIVKHMKSITVAELRSKIADNEDMQIIDVREAHEYAEVNMGAELMPLSELDKHVNKISDDKVVVVHCRSGARSASAIDHLTRVHGFDNLYNLEGGIMAWIDANK